MRLLEKVTRKESLFEKKVKVELSLAEVAAIKVLFANESTSSIKRKLLEDKHFSDVVSDIEFNTSTDISKTLYQGAEQILKEYNR